VKSKLYKQQLEDASYMPESLSDEFMVSS